MSSSTSSFVASSVVVPQLLSIEEYLHTSYHPDCDFVDGHLEERNVVNLNIACCRQRSEHGFSIAAKNGRFVSSLNSDPVSLRPASAFPMSASSPTMAPSRRCASRHPFSALRSSRPKTGFPATVRVLEDYLRWASPTSGFSIPSSAPPSSIPARTSHRRHPASRHRELAHLPRSARNLLRTGLNT